MLPGELGGNGTVPHMKEKRKCDGILMYWLIMLTLVFRKILENVPL